MKNIDFNAERPSCKDYLDYDGKGNLVVRYQPENIDAYRNAERKIMKGDFAR